MVILTATSTSARPWTACALGVAGIVLKDMAPSLVLQCVEKVAAGDVWVEKRSFSRAMEHLLRREAGAQRVAGRLSDREMQVVRLCAQGLCNADIAKKPLAHRGDGQGPSAQVPTRSWASRDERA